MQVSNDAVEMNAKFEGFFENAYLCPAGIWTVGYGTTYLNGRRVVKGDRLSKPDAKELMRTELSKYLRMGLAYISKDIKEKLTQNQLDSIGLLVYNIGPGNFKKSPVLSAINDGEFLKAGDLFLVHNKSKGKVLKGLTNRRKIEREHFIKGLN